MVIVFILFLFSATDLVNQELLKQINLPRKFHMIPSMVGGKYVIRLCVTFEHAKEGHIGKNR